MPANTKTAKPVRKISAGTSVRDVVLTNLVHCTGGPRLVAIRNIVVGGAVVGQGCVTFYPDGPLRPTKHASVAAMKSYLANWRRPTKIDRIASGAR